MFTHVFGVQKFALCERAEPPREMCLIVPVAQSTFTGEHIMNLVGKFDELMILYLRCTRSLPLFLFCC